MRSNLLDHIRLIARDRESWQSGLKPSVVKDFSPHYRPFLWWLYDRIRSNLSDQFLRNLYVFDCGPLLLARP
jgi:hypothetical protein